MGKLFCRRARRGYSLVETLMVIAIIGIIASVAIPLLMDSRCRSLDEKARQTVRVVVSAQAAYQTNVGRFGTLDELANANPPYLDKRFATGSGVMGNDLVIDCSVDSNGDKFEVVTDNVGGYTDFAADERMDIESL
jgi:prepilin-type N-terminal cleavage/methylation domain-containing protein